MFMLVMVIPVVLLCYFALNIIEENPDDEIGMSPSKLFSSK